MSPDDAEALRREHLAEMGEPSASDRAWERWFDRAEALAAKLGGFRGGPDDKGSPLDGDDDRDGFSVDGAYRAWERGDAPGTYVGQAHRRLTEIAQRRRVAS